MTNDVLLEKIDNLKKIVEDGFHGVYVRQDKTNGNVKMNTEFRVRAEGALSVYKWLFGFVGLGNLALILKLIIDL
jgi:hypothetical protein